MAQAVLRPRIALTILSIWVLLQLPRFIAWPLIQSVLAGHDPAAWLFPAIIDIVVAVSGLPLAVLAWVRPGLGTWVYAIVWLTLSIFDHASAVTAFSIAGVPSVFKSFGEGGPAVPMMQSFADLGVFAMLYSTKVRAYFFQSA